MKKVSTGSASEPQYKAIFGDSFCCQKETVTAEKLKDFKIIGVYFSAHWCPPCRAFTPKLAEAYNEYNTGGKKVEIVFVSSDKDKTSWDEYYGEMPWMAIPFADPRIPALKKKYNVTGIPTLVIINSTGKVLCEDAYDDIESKGPTAFEEWNKKS